MGSLTNVTRPRRQRLCFLFAPGKFNLFGEDFHSGFDFLRVRYIVHAHTLVGVRPRFIQTREEVIPRHHQHAALFQPLIQQLGGDRQILKPQPEEDCPLRFVNKAALLRQIAANNGDGFLHPLVIEGLDHRL